ncbi:cyclic pyranopterin monophosphate synthase MoaC [Truepera radiovictrix]|uniref:Molybdenum cofactor biosynthesis protein C n=1 Tax=Truepera radiovictrix (strain DSM 17093 / CIP 108686 / LMG 22925 / RQ-24) TaxID=649638 RepID=D7CU57_TRURR|nr:cyclic pyranopterin monophosphate synthase MoaC [Truepera radiovictrix]ADI13955.1 molybdenum cofactor biosynthesis protein C [Truepera radiovictrix DSM 17093]WMT57481.1 cyclic pyranopterin monophosphate synthase MoaC [Truepera radiovictrix]
MTHFEDGSAVMVDVSEKADTVREATACSSLLLPAPVLAALKAGASAKGDPIAVAELAGIMAAKRTSELIPLCHPLPLSKVAVRGELDEATGRVRFTATCRVTGKTGVEMEALVAASVAALTLYDMLKAHGKGMVVAETKLLSKTGGKSGPWRA